MKSLKFNLRKLLILFDNKYKLIRNNKFRTNKIKLRPLVFKINRIIDWYFINFVKNKLTDIGEFFEPQSLIELIKKWQFYMK